MPVAMVRPEKCEPKMCERGRCVARKQCPTKAIVQLDPGEMPQIDPSLCRGCSDCLAACPARAIILDGVGWIGTGSSLSAAEAPAAKNSQNDG